MDCKIINKYRSKKIFLTLLLLIILINSLLLCILIRKEKTVIYKENKLIYQEINNRTSIFKDNEGNILTVKPVNVALDDELLVTDDLHSSYEINYKDKKIFYDNSKFMDMKTKITLFDGSIYESTPIYVDYNNEQSNQLPDDVKLTYDVINVHINTKGILGNLGGIIMSIILIVFGFINLAYPKEIWEIKYALDVRGGEPTEFAIKSSQVAGVILMFVPTVIILYEIITI